MSLGSTSYYSYYIYILSITLKYRPYWSGKFKMEGLKCEKGPKIFFNKKFHRLAYPLALIYLATNANCITDIWPPFMKHTSR